MAVLGVVIFTGAFLFSMAVIVAMVAPQWQRILRLAAGHIEPSFAPLAQLAVAERRIRLNRSTSAPTPQPRRLREVA